jgi:hypothetical protein
MICLCSIQDSIVSIHLITLILLFQPSHHLHWAVLLVNDKWGWVLVVICRIQVMLRGLDF